MLGFLDLQMAGGGAQSVPNQPPLPLCKIFGIEVNEMILGTNNVWVKMYILRSVWVVM